MLPSLKNIGFDVLGICLDNATPNRRFFTDLCNKSLAPSIQHPESEENRLFLFFDSVHNFKNWYNCFVNKGLLVCPNFRGEKIGNPKFSHIRMLYELEAGKMVKIAFRLTNRVLFPTTIDKTNVRLADSLFHESTIAAMEFYRDNGYPDFSETIPFLKLIRRTWNICNVRTHSIGNLKRDPFRQPITSIEHENLSFLHDFCLWINKWEDLARSSDSPYRFSFTKETFLATRQTTGALIEVSKYLLKNNMGFNYVLLGKFQSDPLEKQFNLYRNMGGCNYYVSVRDVLNAEKSLRFHSLTKVAKIKVTELVDIFSETQELKLFETASESNEIVEELDMDEISIQCLEESVNNVLFFLAGFFSRSLMQSTSCKECQAMIVSSSEAPEINLDFPPDNPEAMVTRDKLLSLVNRGGLVTPTDIIFFTSVYIYNFLNALMAIPECKSRLLAFPEQSSLFVNALRLQMKKDEIGRQICEEKCKNGHSFSIIVDKTALKLFRICFQNIAKTINDQIRVGKKQKSSQNSNSQTRKIAKLS
jgi:hypothetical protein